MTRFNIAFVVPAGFLGCLTMSAALVVGHAEISQLRPHERRMAPVVETAASPFRVMAGVHVPGPAPSHTSVPSPSAATAPAAARLDPAAPVTPPEDLVPADALAAPDVSQPGSLRALTDRQVERAPGAARPALGGVVDTVFDTTHAALGVLGLGVPLQQTWASAEPAYDQAWAETEPVRHAGTETWETGAEAVASPRS